MKPKTGEANRRTSWTFNADKQIQEKQTSVFLYEVNLVFLSTFTAFVLKMMAVPSACV